LGKDDIKLSKETFCKLNQKISGTLLLEAKEIDLLTNLKTNTMNLFHNPSVEDLQSLLKSAPETKIVHDVVLDYDGEVLIDPQLSHPHLDDLSKFKFRVQLTEFSKHAFTMGAAPLRYLYNNLLKAWNSDGALGNSSLA
jgi:hypothetical protein